MQLRGLYAITDEILTPDERVLECVREALEAGVGIIQYRNKTKSDAEVKGICIALQNLCREFNAIFIIDDRPYLACDIGADGIHIGKDDISVKEAREIFPDGIIGVSCYGSVANALKAQEDGADYVAFGSFFASPTKPHSGIVPISVIAEAKKALSIPVCAIGGINAGNIELLAKEKPDMISLISAIFDGDIQKNIALLL